MLLETLHQRRHDIIQLAEAHGATDVRVFGSVVRGEEHANSDVDILVRFPRGYDMFAQRLPLMNALSELLERPVDLIPEHELNRHLRTRVLAEAVPV